MDEADSSDSGKPVPQRLVGSPLAKQVPRAENGSDAGFTAI
jgi:hypothetical protein